MKTVRILRVRVVVDYVDHASIVIDYADTQPIPFLHRALQKIPTSFIFLAGNSCQDQLFCEFDKKNNLKMAQPTERADPHIRLQFFLTRLQNATLQEQDIYI